MFSSSIHVVQVKYKQHHLLCTWTTKVRLLN